MSNIIPNPVTPESIARAKADTAALRAQLTRDHQIEFTADGSVRLPVEELRVLVDMLTLHRLVDTYGLAAIVRRATNMAQITGDVQ